MKYRNILLAVAAILALTSRPGRAEDYPTRPVIFTVPFAAGGTSDVTARLTGQKVSDLLGQPVVIENKPGAGGSLAAGVVARAAPDGYTILLVAAAHAGLGAFYPHLAFDPINDFTPIIQLTSSPIVVVVNAKSDIHTIQDLVAHAKAQPGKLNFAGGGGGPTVTNLAAELFKSETRIDVQGVPYKGSAPALTGLMAGEVQFAFDTLSATLPFVQGGQMRAIAVTTPERSPALPDVPTVSETVVPGFNASIWTGVLGPKGMSPELVARLNKEFNAALMAPDVRKKLIDTASYPVGGTPDQFGQWLKSETARWGGVINKLGLKAE
jgi:tripartite-type tricarboxylate transporter receptor subunit TctC